MFCERQKAPKHVLCQAQYLVRFSVVNIEVNLYVLPNDVDGTGVSTSTCPSQTRIVSMIQMIFTKLYGYLHSSQAVQL